MLECKLQQGEPIITFTLIFLLRSAVRFVLVNLMSSMMWAMSSVFSGIFRAFSLMVSNSEQILWTDTKKDCEKNRSILNTEGQCCQRMLQRSDSLQILFTVAGDHFLQKYFCIVFGFVGQPLFQLFTVQMDHCEVGFCWEADNLLWQNTKLLHLL